MAKRNQDECPQCAEREKRLAVLEQRIAELETQLAKAKKNSGNSSKPPSSDIVNPPPKRNKRGRPKKRKRGGQPGHARHERPLFDEHELDHIWEWRLPACPCCDGPLQDADQEPRRFQQMELKTHPVCIDEHRRIGQWCAQCQKLHYPALPEGLVKAGLVGPRLTALVGWLHGVCHMSVTSIRKYFRDVIQAPVSRGMLSKLLRKVSQSLQDPYDELLALLAHEDQLNVDETGHKDQGRRFWTWCFRAQLYTVFKISPSRGSDVLLQVLGQEFDGVLGCDYFSAYRKYMRLNENVALQFCLAHLIRDVKFLAEHPDAKNREYGGRLRELLRKLFRTIHRRDEYQSETTFCRSLERIRNDLCWEAGIEVVGTREATNMADRFHQHVESYFRFITEAGVEPTNNVAEQAIRFVAIHRRMTQGTRGEVGQRWFERICTVAVTCQQQSRSAFQFLCDSVTALFDGTPSPTLLPVPAD
jgi:transposase